MRMFLQFQKAESVRHLGLLDLQRTMQRALRRSGLPIAYSKGFSPHVVMSFASALSVGISGEAEILDVTLTQEVPAETCLERMNRVLPPALSASRVVTADDRHPALMGMLRQASYDIRLYGEGAQVISGSLPGFLEQASIEAIRKTKSGEKLVDIRPMIHELRVTERTEDSITLYARVSFEEIATLKPEVLVGALEKFAGVKADKARMCRTGLFGVRDGQALPLIEM